MKKINAIRVALGFKSRRGKNQCFGVNKNYRQMFQIKGRTRGPLMRRLGGKAVGTQKKPLRPVTKRPVGPIFKSLRSLRSLFGISRE
jgi:hypothetical protein